jgi:hypothetical protein
MPDQFQDILQMLPVKLTFTFPLLRETSIELVKAVSPQKKFRSALAEFVGESSMPEAKITSVRLPQEW